MKEKIKTPLLILIWIITLITVFCTIFTCSNCFNYNDKPVEFASEYKLTTDNGESKTVRLPYVFTLKEDCNTVTLTVAATGYMYHGGTINFKTSDLGVCVATYGNILYSYEYGTNSQKCGTMWHRIPLDDSYFNRELSITFESLDNSRVSLPQIYYSSSTSHLMSATIGSLPSLIISFFLLAIGITITFLGVTVIRKVLSVNNYFWFVIFCFMASIWIFSDIPVIQILLSTPPLLLKIRLLSFSAMLICLFLHMAFAFKVTSEKTRYICLVTSVLYSATILLLATFKVLSWRLAEDLLHILSLGIISCLIIFIITRFKSNDKHKIIYVVAISVGLLIMGTEQLIKILTIYDRNYFLELTLLLTFIPLTLSIKKFVISSQDAMLKERVLEALAFTDSMTGLFNRTRFTADIKELSASKDHGDVYLAVFDVNNLKMTNDHLGHTAGDKLIVAAAEIISASYGEIGSVYRIGGDEFAVITHANTEKVKEAIKTFTDKTAAVNNDTKTLNVSIAYSIDKFDKVKDKTFTDLFNRVDALMYEHKQNMKRQLKNNNEQCEKHN